MKGPQEAQAAGGLPLDTQHLPYLPGGRCHQPSPTSCGSAANHRHGRKWISETPFAFKTCVSQPPRLPGHRALLTGCRDQSQVLRTSPPSSQPCCARGRCAGRKHLCPAGEEPGQLRFAGAEEQTGWGAILCGSGSLALESVPSLLFPQCSQADLMRPLGQAEPHGKVR